MGLLLDLRKVGLLDVTSSRNLIAKIASIISSYYVGMNYKILVVNPPASLQAAWGIVSGILSEGQLAKACVVTPESTVLRDLFAPHQLEQTYGGTRLDVGAPYYPFQFVPGPFEVSSQGLVENAPVDIHSRLVKPPWVVWKSADSEVNQPLKLELKQDVETLPRVPSDASPRSIKTTTSFKSALSRSESFRSALASHHSFLSMGSASGMRSSSCDTKSVHQTAEEVSLQPDCAKTSTEGWPVFTGPDCSSKQQHFSDKTCPEEEEAIGCSPGVEKANHLPPDERSRSDDDPLTTGSTDAPREADPQGELEEDDEWGFADVTLTHPPPVVFFEVAPERSQRKTVCCLWPFCCPSDSS